MIMLRADAQPASSPPPVAQAGPGRLSPAGEDWVVVAANDDSSGLAFQLAPGNRRPTWPDLAVPQQFHLDIMVEDVAVSGPRVLALGATKLDGDDVYADPAGHPSA
jgi:hypothetical protein